MSDVLVKVDNVSKRFCRSLKRSLWYGLQDLGSEIGGRRHGGGSGLPQSSADVQLRPDEFWAVKDVSFELRRGECLGLIGRNGAGKTTLLRMLNGLIKPDTGRIKTSGQVSALIALGAGFNPILSGKENISINSSILGMGENEAKEKLEEIIEFAEISEYIDSPVQTYSSGMVVRLGFAIASSLNPDILILDEVLAVGDARFRSKCWKRLGELSRKTATILVSHEAYAISRLADVALLMKRGTSSGIQEASQALFDYQSSFEEADHLEPIHELLHPIQEYQILSTNDTICYGSSFAFTLSVSTADPASIDHGVLNIHNDSDLVVAQSVLGDLPILRPGRNSIELEIKDLYLPSGNYSIMIMLSGSGGKIPLIHSKYELSFRMNSIISNGPSFYPPTTIAVGACK